MGYGYGQSCLHPLGANDLHFELHWNRIIDAPPDTVGKIGVKSALHSQPIVGADGENPVASDELVVAHKPKAFTCSSVS